MPKKARTMLLESNLLEFFWAEAISTAVYVMNRSLTKAVTGKTLFEAKSGGRPELSHLCRFSCDAYLHVPYTQRTKLRPKAHFCMFLGYLPSTTKQWWLWNGCLRTVLIGANVEFDKNGFGDWQSEHINL